MSLSERYLIEHRPLEDVCPVKIRDRIVGRGIIRVLIVRVSELFPPAGIVHVVLQYGPCVSGFDSQAIAHWFVKRE